MPKTPNHPCTKLMQGYRASQCGVTKSRNPYAKLGPDGKPNPDRARWDLGWSICFYGEELPGVK